MEPKYLQGEAFSYMVLILVPPESFGKISEKVNYDYVLVVN